MAQSLIGLGNTYGLTLNYRNALSKYQEAEQLAEEIGATEELQEAYEGLAFAYSQVRDFSNAFKYQNLLTVSVSNTLYVVPLPMSLCKSFALITPFSGHSGMEEPNQHEAALSKRVRIIFLF